jgi:hypothetical protein
MDLTPPISMGLLISTVTPGSSSPVSSLIVPWMLPVNRWEKAGVTMRNKAMPKRRKGINLLDTIRPPSIAFSPINLVPDLYYWFTKVKD